MELIISRLVAELNNGGLPREVIRKAVEQGYALCALDVAEQDKEKLNGRLR
jgi:hypothetical protein